MTFAPCPLLSLLTPFASKPLGLFGQAGSALSSGPVAAGAVTFCSAVSNCLALETLFPVGARASRLPKFSAVETVYAEECLYMNEPCCFCCDSLFDRIGGGVGGSACMLDLEIDSLLLAIGCASCGVAGLLRGGGHRGTMSGGAPTLVVE